MEHILIVLEIWMQERIKKNHFGKGVKLIFCSNATFAKKSIYLIKMGKELSQLHRTRKD
jgi:hypothetical protein